MVGVGIAVVAAILNKSDDEGVNDAEGEGDEDEVAEVREESVSVNEGVNDFATDGVKDSETVEVGAPDNDIEDEVVGEDVRDPVEVGVGGIIIWPKVPGHGLNDGGGPEIVAPNVEPA